MPSKEQVKAANLEDVEAICEFGATHISDHYRPLIGEKAAAAQVEKWWDRQRMSAAIGRNQVTVAESEGQLVGVAEWGVWNGTPAIWKLYVHPDRRGEGIGRRLIRGIVDRLPPGTARLQVEHFAANERAGAFYEREGFRVIRTERNESDPRSSVVWRELILPVNH